MLQWVESTLLHKISFDTHVYPYTCNICVLWSFRCEKKNDSNMLSHTYMPIYVYWIMRLQNGFLFYNMYMCQPFPYLPRCSKYFSWSFLILTLPHTQFNHAATHLLRSPGSSWGFLCLNPGGRASTRLLQSRLVRFIGL